MTAAAPSVVVVDYGSGNLRSAERALAHVGADVLVTSDIGQAAGADGVVLPGVGAFGACMAGVVAVGADELIRRRVADRAPVLGICVGMQVLYEFGEEHGTTTAGIAVLTGTIERLPAPVLPHMGWNTVTAAPGSVLFGSVEDERFYFVHSYARLAAPDGEPRPGESITVHGVPFVAAVEVGPLVATQFHPEKSGAAGLQLLRNWVGGLRG